MQHRILVIEDNKSIREDIKMMLEAEGYYVDVAPDGNNVLGQITEGNYDLILSDILMPGMDGYEVLQTIKKQLGFSKAPPFIYVTAKTDKYDLRKGMEIGADDYITKPFTRLELLNAIKIQIEKREEINHKNTSEGDTNNLHKGESPEQSLSRHHSMEESLFISHQSGANLVKISDIKLIQANGDFTNLFVVDKKKFIIRKSIQSWMKILPSEYFFRINRSVIINNIYVAKIDKWFNYTYKISIIDHDRTFIISQSNSRLLRNQLKKI